MSMLCKQNTPNVFLYICCLRELNAAIPETDLVIVINERTLNNTVNAPLLRTLFITLFVICYLFFLTKQITYLFKSIIIFNP